jgi:hypothetical protein
MDTVFGEMLSIARAHSRRIPGYALSSVMTSWFVLRETQPSPRYIPRR